MYRFDLLTPLGLFIGLVLIALAVVSGGGWAGAQSFFNFASFFIVFGGLTAALLVHFRPKEIANTGRVFKQAFLQKEYHPRETVDYLLVLSKKARRYGLLTLEKEVNAVEDSFLKKGIMYVVDGLDEEEIKRVLTNDILALQERHRRGRQVIEKAGDLAPAWGMIGTLVGLIVMLQSLSDPSQLGPKMAIALITTFYGILLANLVFHPIAGKLANLSEEEIQHMYLILDGVLGIHTGKNPRLLEEELQVYLTLDSAEREDEFGLEEIRVNEVR